jgi:dynein light chain roadblock-type
MQQPSPSTEIEALLARLSQRAGVQSTLILARDTGAIVRSSGLLTAEEAEAGSTTASSTVSDSNFVNGTTAAASTPAKKGTRAAEDVARIVCTFMKGVGEMVEGLNGDSDEAKLIRIRTRRNEIVVVPDARFLAVVVHNTPAA